MAMLRYDQLAGHLAKHHLLPKIAPNPNVPEASVYRLSLVEEYQVSSRKKDRPLKLSKNDCQTFKSSFTSFESQIRWCGHWILTVRSINLRKKALPDTITELAKFNRPVKDCTSLKVAFLPCKNSKRRVGHRLSLSRGKRASIRTESNSIPAKVMLLAGQRFFCCNRNANIRAKIDK